jgi:hypothetical protein
MKKEEYKSVQISSGNIVITAKQAEMLKQVLDNVNTIASPPQPANMILGCSIEREIRLVREIRELRRKNNNLIAFVWVISSILIALSIWLLLQ